jgi:hypothetical protein
LNGDDDENEDLFGSEEESEENSKYQKVEMKTRQAMTRKRSRY